MPLNVAVQMDPMHGINIKGDSSFALMLVGTGPRACAVSLWTPRTSAMKTAACRRGSAR